MRRWIFMGVCAIIGLQASAQQVLTVEQAVAIALKNNYDIQVAHNDADIARINNSWGNTNLIPTVGINVTDNYALNNINQKLASGAEINGRNANTNTLNAGAFVNWTLFDGGKMFITKKKLNELQQLGELQLKDKIQSSVYDVVSAYYDIVRQKQQLNAIEEAIKYNTERAKISQTRFDAGLSAKTDLLQAKIDLNGYKENAITQRTVIVNAKRKLNQLLSRDVDEQFDVLDTVPLNYTVNKRELAQKLYSSNASILSSQKQIEVATQAMKEYKTQYLPKLAISAGYNYARSDNSAGFTLHSQTYGPQVGGTLNIPLYQAGVVKRQVEIARIQIKSAEYSLEKAKLQANLQLQNAITDYENQRQLFELEKESAQLSKENIDISAARLRLGQASTLEARQAELNYQNSLSKLSNIQYTLKVAETRLKQLLAEF